MSFVIRNLLAVVIGCLAIEAARAAVIDAKLTNGLNAIEITGEINQGDSDQFQRLTEGLAGPAAVFLNSRGGSVVEGLMIGAIIRSKAYATVVPNDTECASVCGLIWLAGAKRYVASSGKVGFHAAYTGSGDAATETGVGNAVIGAYLANLGLSYNAVTFVTSAGPHEMRWLHPADARQAGINCIVLPNSEPAQAPAAQVEDTVPSRSPLERRMMDVVLSYFDTWSEPGPDIHKMVQYYGDSAIFWGSSASRKKIMREKQDFADRWPVRHYAVRTSTLVARCSDTCSVTGVVEWDVHSTERNAHSVGAANFVFKIAPNGSEIGGLIVSENGAVLSRYADNLPSRP